MSCCLSPGVSSSKPRFAIAAATVVLILLGLWTWSSHDSPRVPPLTSSPYAVAPGSAPSSLAHTLSEIDPEYVNQADRVADYLTSYPLTQDDFGQMGKRLRVLKEWMYVADNSASGSILSESLQKDIESLALSLTPFINPPSRKQNKPLERLVHSFVPGSKGIVITSGKKRFRFACHLIHNLREVLGSTLPIQIAHAGENVLPRVYRDFITSLGPDISTIDITSIFEDSTLGLPEGGWAIKAFAALGSTFEQVVLMDADAIFLQKPEVMLDTHPGYLETGTLLFHDRLLWQGAFKDRHDWWEKELEHTKLSETIKHSKVYVENFAEEGDSGVVIVDKGRLGVVIGLLHICWQNTKAVREAWTYRLGYGDKESWWFGFELTETPYAMEKHYGAIVGHTSSKDRSRRVCSFTIAHVDHKNRLLWYNGSLLKNKEIDADDFDVPTDWMVDGVWEKGATKQDMSCMRDATIQKLDTGETEILRRTVEAAKQVDTQIREKLG